MPRTPRFDYPGARHHVMNRGARKAPIFFGRECCQLFHDLLAELPERYNVVIHGYTLMPNHFHLLLQTPSGNLSRAMRFLCGQYARKLNLAHEWDGPLFMGRFKNKAIEDERYWKHLLAYIHLNPVRAGLEQRIWGTDWTSHRIYMGLEEAPPWLYLREMLGVYGTPAACQRYLDDLQHGRVLAPQGFERAALWKRRGCQPEIKKRPPAPSHPAADTFETAIEELTTATGLSREELTAAPRGPRGNQARWLTAWWLRSRDRMTGGEVAQYLGVSQARISQMVNKARQAGGEREPLGSWMQALRPGKN